MGCHQCPGNQRVKRIKQKQAGNTRRVVIILSGMHCKHCEMMVKSVLESLGDIKDLVVERGRASFQAPRDLDLAPVLDALKELGYGIDDIR